MASLGREYDVIEDRDAEDPTGFGDALRHFAILDARTGIPARMVVSEDERRGAREDGGLEDLAWMDECLVRSADGHDLVRDGPMAAVEVDRQEVLAGVIAHDLAREAHSFLRALEPRLAPEGRPLVLHPNLA